MTLLRDCCIGRWHGILIRFGIDRTFLTGRHCACPRCGGKDRFRFDNKDGKGSWYCNNCGSGDGFKLLMLVRGWTFAETARRVEEIVGGIQASLMPQARPEEDRRASLNRLWRAGRPIEAGDPVALYLAGRSIDLKSYPLMLRFVEKCRYPSSDGGAPRWLPAMVARVDGPDGKPASVHRTFLGRDGRKADVEAPRLLMPGSIAKGSAVRLSEAGPILGVGEGIETSLSAAILWRVPTWAALNVRMLAAFEPPLDVEELIVFGDSDANFAGQAAAFALANRVAAGRRRLRVHVQLPGRVGWDWNDYLIAGLVPRRVAGTGVPGVGGVAAISEVSEPTSSATTVAVKSALSASDPAQETLLSELAAVDLGGLRLVEAAATICFDRAA